MVGLSWPDSTSSSIRLKCSASGLTRMRLGPHAVGPCIFLCVTRGTERDEDPAPSQDTPGTPLDLTTQRVQHDVHVAHHILKPGRLKVDIGVDTQLVEVVAVSSAGRTDDACATRLGQL